MYIYCFVFKKKAYFYINLFIIYTNLWFQKPQGLGLPFVGWSHVGTGIATALKSDAWWKEGGFRHEKTKKKPVGWIQIWKKTHFWLVVSSICLFSPRNLGKWSNLTNMFQMGWLVEFFFKEINPVFHCYVSLPEGILHDFWGSWNPMISRVVLHPKVVV